MESIYIIGHKNPDADSICSALAYADFKESIARKIIKPRVAATRMRE